MTTSLARFDQTMVNLVKEHLMDPDATVEDLELFLHQCQVTGLNPLAKQIYPVHRFDRRFGRKKMSIQVSIDGFRLIAERSKDYEGQEGPYWCGDDGVWVDVWLHPTPPRAAKVGVWRKGFKSPLWRVARWESFAQTDSQGRLTQFWNGMGEHMLAKVAESLALRAAFPQELSGLYTTEEMQQVDGAADEQYLSALTDSLPGAVVVEGKELEFQTVDGEAVEADPVPDTPQAVEDIKTAAQMVYDDAAAMYTKWFGHYGVDDWSGMSDEQVKEVYVAVMGQAAKLINPQQLKALHAKANDVASARPDTDPFDWDMERPVWVTQVTNGRTSSSKKLFVSEFHSLMDWMAEELGEKTPFNV